MQSINNMEVGSDKIEARSTGSVQQYVAQDSMSSSMYGYIGGFFLPDEEEGESIGGRRRRRSNIS